MARRRGGEDESMPATGAGLIRYFKEETHGVKVSPKAIVAIAIGIIILEVLLRFYGQAILGF